MSSIESSPTYLNLKNNREKANIVDSPLHGNRLFNGKEFFFYQDGSVLAYSAKPAEEFHYITKEGRQRGRSLRSYAQHVIEDPRELGQPFSTDGTWSVCYTHPASDEVILIKSTAEDKFEDREKLKNEHFPPENTRIDFSLRASLSILENLRRTGVSVPDFYGFSLIANKEGDIKEYQFMQFLNRLTVRKYEEMLKSSFPISIKNETDPKAFFIYKIITEEYAGNIQGFLADMQRSYDAFKQDVRRKVPLIGDFHKANVLFVGYANSVFHFMVIDPGMIVDD